MPPPTDSPRTTDARAPHEATTEATTVAPTEVLRGAGLSHSYAGEVKAVDGVDIELPPGELLVVIGPNGAGKSTLLKILAGLVTPEAGTIELGGRPLASLDPRSRARSLAVVPQSLRAIPEVTVRHFVLGGRYGHLDKWRRHGAVDDLAVDRALAEADVSDVGHRLLTQISGGQRQRVLIARSLAQQAATLLVDEPTNSLDPEHQIAVFSLIRRLVDKGRSALVVTHDMNLASQFAGAIALMAEGRIVASGAAGQVLRPEVLGPVYGDHLRYGTWPAPGGEGTRPYVVPWLE